MEQPPGYVHDNSILVCLLKKSLYGLKQVPRPWYAKMDRFLLDTGFSRCYYDTNLNTKKVVNNLIILVLYADDYILTGSDPKLLTQVRSSLNKKFETTNLGHLYYFLGLQVLQTKEGIFFLNLSIHVTFFVAFTWKIVNQPHFPSTPDSNLLPLALHPKYMPPCIVN